MKQQVKLGIIGGTGLYQVEGLEIIEKVHPETPWGKPSDEITIARYKSANGDFLTAFLPRHGRGHFILPSEIPQKANMAALKMLGVENIFAFSAVGSLKEEIAPTHYILPDQIMDRTRHREDTFFGGGIVAHVSFGDPFCSELADIAAVALKKQGITFHRGETLICMEGPAFSTRAESKLYKSWGAGIINMSVLPEAKLARELEICYQMICMSTDYDSWRESEGAVQVEEIMAVVKQNSENAAVICRELIPVMAEKDKKSHWHGSVKFGLITAPEKRPAELKAKLNTVLPGTF